MTSTFDRQANGQVLYKPDKVLDVPNVDVMTLLFGKSTGRVLAFGFTTFLSFN